MCYSISRLITIRQSNCNCNWLFPLQSHTGTVVRECCEGDDASQWENGKFDPLPPPNPLTDRHKKLHTWLRHGNLRHSTFSRDPSRGSFSPYARNCASNVYSASFFPGSSNSLQPRRLNRFSRVIRQTGRRGSAQGCAFLGLEDKNVTITPRDSGKTAIFWARFWRDWKFSTENRFTMGVLPCKLPLIVVVAP